MKKYALVPIEQWDSEMKVIVEEPSSCTAAAANVSFENYIKKEDKAEETIDNRLQREDEIETNNSEETLDPAPDNASSSLPPSPLSKQTKTSEDDETSSKTIKPESSSRTIKPLKKREASRISPFNHDARNKKKINEKLGVQGKKKKKIKKHTETRGDSELERKEVESKSEKGRRTDRIRKPSRAKLESIESEKLWIL